MAPLCFTAKYLSESSYAVPKREFFTAAVRLLHGACLGAAVSAKCRQSVRALRKEQGRALRTRQRLLRPCISRPPGNGQDSHSMPVWPGLDRASASGSLVLQQLVRFGLSRMPLVEIRFLELCVRNLLLRVVQSAEGLGFSCSRVLRIFFLLFTFW